MLDTNLFTEMDPTYGNAPGSWVDSMAIWEAEGLRTKQITGTVLV